MCGQMGSGADATCSIRQQNKDVCTRCDTGIWFHVKTQQHFKWCKGCKKFMHVHSFRGGFLRSPSTSKCDACRQRGRQSYATSKKRDDKAPTAAGALAPGTFAVFEDRAELECERWVVK